MMTTRNSIRSGTPDFVISLIVLARFPTVQGRIVKTEIELLLEARQIDYDSHLAQVGNPHLCAGDIEASVRLHFVRPDGSGEPRFLELARMLVRYITMYCFDAQKRNDLSEVDRNALFVEARDLFRKSKSSGQVGEMLIYFFLEAVLKAPQALREDVAHYQRSRRAQRKRWSPLRLEQ
jgi:hypothetical protein